MVEFPTAFVPKMEVLSPDMGLGAEIDETLQSFQERGIVVGHGLTPRLANSLAESAMQPHIVEFCPSQPDRFGDPQLAETWQGKGRMMVTLNQVKGLENRSLSDADLRAVREEDTYDLAHGWAGLQQNTHIPDADVTTAYRVVECGLHRGLARPLGKMVVDLTTVLYDVEPERVSLETWASNTYAVRTYLKLGFAKLAEAPDVRPTLQKQGRKVNGHEVFAVTEHGVTVYKVPDTRLFMRNDPTGRFAEAA